MNPRKRFGQHFLRNKGIIQKILESFKPQKTDHVVEIGPGQGALTASLAESVYRLDLIEIDRDLADSLKKTFADHNHVHVHQTDVLAFKFECIKSDPKLRIIGNLPYNISTPLFFHLLDQIELIDDVVVMVQKEVANRMCAKPFSKQYGRLSVVAQLHTDIKILFPVAPGSFFPVPAVDSAVIQIKPKQQRPDFNHENLQRLLKTAFSNRRKTLKNTLKHFFSTQQMLDMDLDMSLRPDQIDVATYANLSLMLSK